MSSGSEFNQPRIHFNEVTVNATANQYINAEIYKVSRPTLIDYICITEESATVNGVPPGPLIGTNNSQLNNMTVNWWVSDRGRTALRPRIPLFYDNYIDAFRTPIVLTAAPSAIIQGPLLWRFREPWRYQPGNSFTLDWSYVFGQLGPAGAPAIPFPIDIIFYGVGVRTRHRRIFEMTLTVPAPAVGPVTGSFTQAEFISNLTDEPYDLYEMQIRVNGVDAVGNGWNDMRQLNMLRFRINPSQSEPFSDDMVPIIMYGVDQGPVGRSIWYEPTGGPLLLEAGTSIGWEIFNTNAAGLFNINFQAGLIGRTAPNRGGALCD